VSRTRKTLVFALAGLALVAALGAGAVALALRGALEPAGPAGAPPVLFHVPRGTSLSAVARRLEGQGLIRDARALGLLARWRGQAERLHAGEYELTAAASAGEILDTLVTGKVKHWEVALPEGLRIEEIAARLAGPGLVEADAFIAFAWDPASARALGVAGPTLEGYLFPETYRLPRGLSTREVARTLVNHFLQVWKTLEPLAAERGMDMREVVTLASIVEKETGAASERPLIAGVFHNRLERGMRLESDPTTIYGIQDFDGNLTRAHLEDAGNVYNTYKIPALPPGPIASPGAAALRAVLEPAPTPYLFFVSRNDGTHVFARSFKEHEANVDRYQRSKRRKSRK
jgi:UPF0755 protein